MSDDTIFRLIPGDGNIVSDEPKGPQPREYLFHFKGDNEPISAFGYPAFNGQLYAVLDEMDDAATINFICQANDIKFVADSERVTETA